MFRVVSSNTNGVGALEVVPRIPSLRRNRSVSNQQLSITPENISSSTTMAGPLSNNQSVYRVHFSIVEKNRSWIRGTKRSIRWVFGLTNLKSLSEGKVGRDCRGEEHVVELVRNKTSGKIRLYWNKGNITHYFRQRYINSEPSYHNKSFEYTWKTRSGEILRVVCSVDLTVDEPIKFDLFVDDMNFKSLPTVGQLGRRIQQLSDYRSPQDDVGSQRSLDSSIATNDVDIDQGSDVEQGFRLSIVGYNSMTSGEDEINDELYSNLYSNSLGSLRNQIVSCLPQTEEMVSRAIINAFFVDSQNTSETVTYFNLEEINHHQIEAEYILEAYQWMKLNAEIAPRPDVDEMALQFLQKHIDNIFLLIRNEELNSDDAARIVFSVASVLDLPFANKIAQDTIILDDLPPGTTTEELRLLLSPYGEIDALSMSVSSKKFGFCRFVFEESICKVLHDHENGGIVVNRMIPHIIALSSLAIPDEELPSNLPRDEASLIEPNQCDPKVEMLTISTTASSPPHLLGFPSFNSDCIIRHMAKSYVYSENHGEACVH